MNFEELKDKVLRWACDKSLLYYENADKQFMKIIEEVFEFKSEFDLYNYTPDFIKEKAECDYNLKLEMGDIFVTLIILCEQLGLDPVDCLSMAYEKIKDRKGRTIGGNFYKQEDLEGKKWEK